MKQLVPVCPFLLESDSSSKIYFSNRFVSHYYPLHSHDFYEIELITKGRGKQWINNVCIPIQKGSLYLITLSDVHRIEAEEPLHVISIHYLLESAQQFDLAHIQDARFLQLSDEYYNIFYQLASKATKEKNDDLLYCDQQKLSTAMLMLIHLLRYGNKYTATTSEKRMQQALKCIHEEYARADLRLRYVADQCGLSACYFSTTFRKVVGCGFSEYLMNYRLHLACSLLASQNLSITEIAYEVGFASLSHFFRVFREIYHCTPRQYRQTALSSGSTALEKPSWDSSIVPAPPIPQENEE